MSARNPAQNAVAVEQAGTPAGIELGAGPTLLLLHGLTGTWHIWKPVLSLLRTRFRVIAVTLPGHYGARPYQAAGDATVNGLADQLLTELAARGIDRAHVAGNSLGGWLALELARRGFAQSVTAFSPAGSWRRIEDYRAVARPFRIFFTLMPLIIFLTTLFLRFAGLRKALGKQTMEHGERVPEAELRASMVAMSRTTVLPGLLRTMGRDGPIAPMTVTVPVRIAWSEHDQVIPFDRYGTVMMERMSGAEGVIVPGVGHVPMYDDPEAVVRHITEVVATAEANAAAMRTRSAA